MVVAKELQAVVDLCRVKNVSFSLTFEESGGTWYYEVNSNAPVENTVSRSRCYESTIEGLIEYLEKL